MFACFISWTLTFTANVSCMKIALCELPSSHDSTSPRKTWKFSRWSFRLARKGSKILSSKEKDCLKYWKYSSMPFLFMIAGTNVLSRWGECGTENVLDCIKQCVWKTMVSVSSSSSSFNSGKTSTTWKPTWLNSFVTELVARFVFMMQAVFVSTPDSVVAVN